MSIPEENLEEKWKSIMKKWRKKMKARKVKVKIVRKLKKGNKTITKNILTKAGIKEEEIRTTNMTNTLISKIENMTIPKNNLPPISRTAE